MNPGATGFSIPPKGWLVGAVYNDTGLGPLSAAVSKMAQPICRPIRAIGPAKVGTFTPIH